MGFRFRIHDASLPGTPDIVLKRYGTVVLVHGCFWHGHGCSRGKMPSSRGDFWFPKLEKNRARDARQIKELRSMGWRVWTIWECETKDETKLRRRLEGLFS
jgi:DNA mismatch endonuclease (patch repair protein)